MESTTESGWEGTPRADEEAVRAEIGAVGAFDFLDVLSAVLAMAIDHAANLLDSRSDPKLREIAMLQAAIRAFRGIRTASAVIASGYALEAEPYTRMLMELYVSAKAVLGDQTDQEAEKWLRGAHARGLGTRVKAAIPDPAVYGQLSQATHGDPRALARALLQESEGELRIEWGPARTAQSEEQLRHLAFTARDFCVLLEQAGLGRRPELDAIDQALQRLEPTWRPDAEFPSGGEEAK
jgi:hypothetical protein